ncbi:MAG: type IX secretion system membrane protein PorP/SprF [Elusimicrobia bacterium]|jgi:tetratricopeptide (TPR) repeat protein|nr:type IX secretion system membrane protein PorP/SprF [Elusimicrobiota bacterium]
MKYFKLKLYILVAILSFNTAALRAQFIDTGAGARAAGMANAFTAEASGPETIYYNPAGIVNAGTYQLATSYSRLFWGLTDKSNLGKGYIGYIMPVNEKIGAGFAWHHFMLDNYYSEETFCFSGAYRVNDKLSAGLNLKLLNKNYASTPYTESSVDLNTGQVSPEINPVFKNGYSKFGFTPDIGALYRFNYAHRVGLSLKNITLPDMALSDEDTDRLPLEIKTGYRYITGNMRVLVDLGYSADDFNFYTGAENWFLGKTFAVRGGIGIGSRLYRNAALGASYRFNNTFKIDYAFNYPLAGIASTYGTHKLGFIVKFGVLSKAEKDSQDDGRPISKEDNTRANEVVDSGMKLFEENKFLQAREKFREALKINPESSVAKAKLEETVKMQQVVSDKIRESKKKYLKGVYHLNRSEYREAALVFEELLNIDTMGDGELEDLHVRSREKYDELKNEKVVRVGNYISKAEDYYSKLRYDDALKYYRKALEVMPSNTKARSGVEKVNSKFIEKYYEAGINYHLDENYGKAREEFEKVLKLNKNHKQSLNMLKIIGEER